MRSLKSIQKSIHSASSLESIVSTMKAYASSNILHFQNAADASRSYGDVLSDSLYMLFAQEDEPLPALQEHEGQTIHLVFGSDFGLTGRFNERIVEYALPRIPAGKNDKLIAIGYQIMTRMQRKHKVAQFFSVPQTEEGITPVVQRILLSIDEGRKERPVGRILLYYNKPIGKASMKEVQETLFPLDLAGLTRKPEDWNSKSLPIVLMDRERVLSDLIQQIFFISLYRTFCFSLVTENASRLASMQSAEKNIQERLEELEFRYRRERQSQITEDISDIISGYKAIKKHKLALE